MSINTQIPPFLCLYPQEFFVTAQKLEQSRPTNRLEPKTVMKKPSGYNDSKIPIPKNI